MKILLVFILSIFLSTWGFSQTKPGEKEKVNWININEHFYAVKLNAETKDTISWNNQLYNYTEQYRVNQFTLFATGRQLRFPSTIIFTKKDNPVSIPGYLRTGDIESILKYFGEGIYQNMSFPQFAGSFKNKW